MCALKFPDPILQIWYMSSCSVVLFVIVFVARETLFFAQLGKIYQWEPFGKWAKHCNILLTICGTCNESFETNLQQQVGFFLSYFYYHLEWCSWCLEKPSKEIFSQIMYTLEFLMHFPLFNGIAFVLFDPKTKQNTVERGGEKIL